MRIKQIFFLIVLSASLCAPAIAQTGNDDGPEIIIISKNAPIFASEPEIITAKINGKTPSPNIEYLWSVSKGIIEDGQGTPQIQYLAIGDSETVNVTLKVSGLPKNCSGIFSKTFAIKIPPPIQDPDIFGKLSLNDYRARLDNALIGGLGNDSHSELILSLRFDKKDNRNYKISLLKNISKFITYRKFDKTRFSLIISEGEEESTFWIIPPGMDYPKIENSKVIKAEELNQKLNKLFSIK